MMEDEEQLNTSPSSSSSESSTATDEIGLESMDRDEDIDIAALRRAAPPRFYQLCTPKVQGVCLTLLTLGIVLLVCVDLYLVHELAGKATPEQFDALTKSRADIFLHTAPVCSRDTGEQQFLIGNLWTGAGNWLTSRAPMHVARQDHDLVVNQGSLWAVGGTTSRVMFNGSQDMTASLEQYQPTIDMWIEQSHFALPTPRSSHCAEVVKNKLYVFGGHTPESPVQPVASGVQREWGLGNRWSGRWESMPDMPLALADAACTVLNDKIYVFGGHGVTDKVHWRFQLDVSKAVLVFDPSVDDASQRWSTLSAELDPPRSKAVAETLSVGSEGSGARIFLVGGFGQLGGGRRGWMPDVEEFDPGKNTFFSHSALHEGRGDKAVAVLFDKIYVMGGVDPVQWGRSDKNEEKENHYLPLHKVVQYDPRHDTWTEKAPLPSRRARAAASTLEGVIFVAGGVGRDFGPSAELFAYYEPQHTNVFACYGGGEELARLMGIQANER